MIGRKRCECGQLALVDSIMFMTVMLVASAVVIGYSGFQSSASRNFADLQQYTTDFADTLLAAELSNLEYIDGAGEAVNTGSAGKGVGQLLCDEVLMLENGTELQDFTAYNAAILRAARALIRPGLDCALACEGTSVFVAGIDAASLPQDRHASWMTLLPGGGSGPAVNIIVYVWVV